MKKFVAATVSAFIFLSPGFRAGQAFAQVIAPNAAQSASVGVMTVPAGLAGVAPAGASARVNLSAPNLSAPSLLTTVPALAPTPSVRASAAQASALALPTAAALTPARALAASPKAVAAEAAATQARAAAKTTVGSMTKQVAAAVEAVGPVSEAAPSAAHDLGGRLEAVLNGTRRVQESASAVAPENNGWQGLSHDRYFGKPAGYESIAGAVKAHNSRVSAAAAETPEPAPQDEPAAPRGEKAPFFPKLISAGLALVPALAIGWPLLAAGSLLAGGSVIAASAVLMALPFMGERTPAYLRALPGAAVLGLGALTLAAAFTGGASLWMGSFVALGGWGLLRYGLKTEQKDRYDREKALSAYFGSVGAVLGAGLALAAAAAVTPLAAPAWLVVGATWAAYPLTALLFMHLPGWVGEGISAALRSTYSSGRAVHRVLGSLKRDTVMYDRLTAFTKRHLQSSPWNAIWLSGVWIPVWVSEAAMALLSVAAGLAFGAAMAPTMFAWGAVHKLWEKSAANKFLGAWNHFIFDWAQGSKISVYNRAAKPLVAMANKNHGAVSIAASLGLRVLQLAWLAYAVVGFPVVAAIGFFRAFGKTSGDYDYKRHSPDALKVDTNDRPDVERPDEPVDPSKPGKSTWVPRLVASAIAALPLYFLALPLLGTPLVGQLFGLTGLALLAMPFMPAATPKYLKQLPGYLLIGLGLATSLAVPYFIFGEVGLVVVAGNNAFWMGLVTALSGWGMVRYIGTLGQKEGQKWYSVDDPEYIGAFFGALGVLTGLGVSLMGMTGWLPLAFKVGGYLTSLLLLMHLPEWVGRGLKASAEGLFASAKAFSRVASFWERDTDFYKNLRKHASYWLDKSVWNGSWLSVIWVPTAALMLAEWAASAVLGLVTGLLRAPLNFVWGAAYELAPESKFTRFAAGFTRATFERAEGSKKTVFDRWVAALVPMMNEANPVSGRPTLKAAFAFLVARLAQLAWLARLVFWAPAILILSLFDGVKNASGEKPKPGEDEYGDKDNPGHVY